jgi:DNA polymerase III subunit delta'
MSVWDRVIGQPAAVAQFQQAAASAHGDGSDFGMTHAWLITGPPGSGRSVAGLALAASLVCPRGGCGACDVCHTAITGVHPDVEVVRSTTLSMGKDQTKALVARGAGAPTSGAWRCFVIQDADRMTEAAANTLLKAIEEPTQGTVWILCAPSSEDLLPTIRSRARHVGLRIPEAAAVSQLLQSEGVDPPMAAFAAAASQGHIGRARALATEPEVRSRRALVLRIPRALTSITEAYALAHDLKKLAEDEAKERTRESNEEENTAMMEAYGQGASGISNGRIRRLASRALSDLAKTQQQRSSRSVRDELDRYFVDLLGFYRDVMVLQLGAGSALINADVRPAVEQAATTGDSVMTMRRIEALSAARAQLEGNVPPALVCESLMVQLLHPVTNSNLSPRSG